MPHDELLQLVLKSETFTDILKVFGLSNKGGNAGTLKRRLKEENIDYSHINQGMSSNKGRKFPYACMTKEECISNLFVNPTSFKRSTVKRYLIKYEMIPYQCQCGLKNEWRGKHLSLQLEHKDGNGDNSTIDNLEWICPNCHSQTSTFAGRSLRKLRPIKKSILNPNWRYEPRIDKRKVERPPKEELKRLTETIPITKIGKSFNVSDATIRKWCKCYEISPHPYGRGYWQKKIVGKIL